LAILSAEVALAAEEVEGWLKRGESEAEERKEEGDQGDGAHSHNLVKG
jgi:hypothetical protein